MSITLEAALLVNAINLVLFGLAGLIEWRYPEKVRSLQVAFWRFLGVELEVSEA